MAHKIDLFVGKKIKQIRTKLKISQSHLAEKIGVSFQQIQKYESGINRVSSSKLWEISKILKADIDTFFPYPEEEKRECYSAQ